MFPAVLIALIILELNCFVEKAGCQTPLPRPKGCRNVSVSEEEVDERYFKPHGKWQRPRLNSSEPVNVNVTLFLTSINDVLEKERIIKLTGYIGLRWIDEFRVWKNDFPYNCVDYVVLPADEIWLPDIAQMNAEERYTLMRMEGEKARVYSYGYTTYSPGGTFMAFYFDMTWFPFDTQRCAIKFESWRYTANYMTFNFNNNLTTKGWSENEQWSLVSTSQAKIDLTYLDPGNSFDHIEFYVVMKRKVAYYLMNVIIPSTIISVAQLATFSLPVDEVLKLHISFTCLLAYSVFQLMIVEDMPRSSDHVPLLSIYIDLQMGYISLSMILEGLVFLALRQAEPSHHRRPTDVPKLMYGAICLLGQILFVGDPPKRPPPQSSSNSNASALVSILNSGLFSNEQIKRDIEKEVGPDEKDISNRENDGDNNRPQIDWPMVDQLVFEQRYTPMNFQAQSSEPQSQANAQNTAGNTHGHQQFADFRQIKWYYAADVFERLAFIVYLSCLVITPVVMFGIHPALNASSHR